MIRQVRAGRPATSAFEVMVGATGSSGRAGLLLLVLTAFAAVIADTGCPQLKQNRAVSGLSLPQWVQNMVRECMPDVTIMGSGQRRRLCRMSVGQEEGGNPDVECLGELVEMFDAGIPPAQFNLCKVGALDLSVTSQVFLRPSVPIA